MKALLETEGRRFFLLFGMEPFFSRGSGEMKRGKTAIAFPVIFPPLVAAYSVTSRGTMLFLRPLPPPAEPGALWMQGRGDNSGNMVLLSLASPLGEEGHEVAKGCWRVRIGKKLKVEQAAYRRSRPRWSVTSVLDLVHPLPLRGVPLKGKREIETGDF